MSAYLIESLAGSSTPTIRKKINIKISSNLGHLNLGAVKVKILFWTTTFFIIYTYILYPVGIWALSRRKPSTETTDPIIISEWPNITVIVAVYNEQHRIINKIRNLQALDYDQDHLMDKAFHWFLSRKVYSQETR